MDTTLLARSRCAASAPARCSCPAPGVMGAPRNHDEAVAGLRRAVELGVVHIEQNMKIADITLADNDVAELRPARNLRMRAQPSVEGIEGYSASEESIVEVRR